MVFVPTLGRKSTRVSAELSHLGIGPEGLEEQ
jgi:hypothetical protein